MNRHDHTITLLTIRCGVPCRGWRHPAGRAQALATFVLFALPVAVAAGSPASAGEPARDRSSMRAAIVSEELRQRGCDKLSGDAAVRACVDAALATVYPAGFSNRPADTP